MSRRTDTTAMAAIVVVAVLALLACATPVLGGAKACPYPCQNGGVCTPKGHCTCALGFVGIDCTRRGCNTNCNHRGYCDLSSSPPSCLCFPGFGGLECELLASTPEQEAAAALAASKGNGAAGGKTKGHGWKNGAGAYNGSAGSNATDSLPKVRPVDRTICNPACHPDTGVCWQGRCACKDGFTGPTCSDRLCPDDCSYHGVCHKKTGECECYKPYTGLTCAGASEPIVPRTVDTLDDVAGPEIVPTNQKINRLYKEKKGLSDNFHLLESASRIRQAKAAATAAGGDE